MDRRDRCDRHAFFGCVSQSVTPIHEPRPPCFFFVASFRWLFGIMPHLQTARELAQTRFARAPVGAHIQFYFNSPGSPFTLQLGLRFQF